MQEIDPSIYGPFSNMIPSCPEMDLSSGNPDISRLSEFGELANQLADTGGSDRELEMSQCCLSAIWLFNDFLEQSHLISQTLYSQAGSYLHGIMHRREGDFANSRHWLRKTVGADCLLAVTKGLPLCSDPALIARCGTPFDPAQLTTLVEQNLDNDSLNLKKLTFTELWGLFDWCFHQTTFTNSN
ncbi:hypothetical protein OAG56_04355 [Mariniblastus sp.]|nr:hypothetical protein [Mariniblastus sp.]MDB4756583.1 hypothetical protein [Mariniblastus sp.]